jgi:Glycosyl transferase 4-like domain
MIDDRKSAAHTSGVKRRQLLVVADEPASPSDFAARLDGVAQGLSGLGWDVTVLSSDEPEESVERLTDSDARRSDNGARSVPREQALAEGPLTQLRTPRAGGYQPHAVLVSASTSSLQRTALMAARSAGAPLIVDRSTSPVRASSNESPSQRDRQDQAAALDRTLAESARAVLVTSVQEAAELIRHNRAELADRIRVIADDPEDFARSLDRVLRACLLERLVVAGGPDSAYSFLSAPERRGVDRAHASANALGVPRMPTTLSYGQRLRLAIRARLRPWLANTPLGVATRGIRSGFVRAFGRGD